jgi:hypothetical protein
MKIQHYYRYTHTHTHTSYDDDPFVIKLAVSGVVFSYFKFTGLVIYFCCLKMKSGSVIGSITSDVQHVFASLLLHSVR